MLILISIILLFNLPRLSIPLAIAYVIYLIVSPLVPFLMKFGIKRTLSIVIVLIGILFSTLYPIVKVFPVISQESKNFQYYLPVIETNAKNEWSILREQIMEKTGVEIHNKYVDDVIDYIKDVTTNFLLTLPKFLASVLEWFFLVPLIIFFLLKDGKIFKQKFLRMAPNAIFERFYHLSHEFNKQLGDYIFAKFVEASIVGVIITSGLLIADVRFAFLLGIAAALTNIIPYVGPFLGMIPGVVFVLVEYGLGSTFGVVMIFYVVANAIDIALVFPILVSKIVNIHPLVVVTSVILGSQYLGIVGMVISIPVAAAAKLIFSEVYKEIYNANN